MHASALAASGADLELGQVLHSFMAMELQSNNKRARVTPTAVETVHAAHTGDLPPGLSAFRDQVTAFAPVAGGKLELVIDATDLRLYGGGQRKKWRWRDVLLGGGDVTVEQQWVSLRLLLALVPSLARALSKLTIAGLPRLEAYDAGPSGRRRACEGRHQQPWCCCCARWVQAVEVVCAGLASDRWPSFVKKLRLNMGSMCGSSSGAPRSHDRCCDCGPVQAYELLGRVLHSAQCTLLSLAFIGSSGRPGDVAAASKTRHNSLAEEGIDDEPASSRTTSHVVDGACMSHVVAALSVNTSLMELKWAGCTIAAEALRSLCDALSRPPYSSGSPIVSGLKLLGLTEIATTGGGDGGGAAVVAQCVGNMLARNASLQVLSLVGTLRGGRDGDPEEEVSHAAGGGHLAEGLRRNTTLLTVDVREHRLCKASVEHIFRAVAANAALKKLYVGSELRMGAPAAPVIAQMMSCNRTLQVLDVGGAPYSADEWVDCILPALVGNDTLKSVSLHGCQGIRGVKVVDALLRLVRKNTVIQTINLDSTPLDRAGKTGRILEELRLNRDFRHTLSAMPTSKPKACRIVLCGREYAGQSALEVCLSVKP